MSALQSDQQPHQRRQLFDTTVGSTVTHKILEAVTHSTGLPSDLAAQSDLPDVDFATLQVSGGAAADKDAKSDTKEESHEHPCVCDLRLPRKALSNEQRFALAKDWLRSGSSGRGPKSPSSSSERKRVAATRPAKRVAAARPAKRVVATRPAKPVADTTAPKAGQTRTSPKKRKPGADERELVGRTAGVGSGKRTTARSRSRGPRLAVKLNRAATLRMEKGTTYCGKRPLAVNRFQIGRVQGTEEVKKKQRKARPVDANCQYRVCKRIR
ncbi:hypothetical protein V9T40_014277 [Parthenolecanium corni]|uniref:Uncharacterized protein n=1 Tax=Parthenolecanium corni TaxID=536013 RepID=A0AAN9T4D1_9HEMI